jgi:hypothetical protein
MLICIFLRSASPQNTLSFLPDIFRFGLEERFLGLFERLGLEERLDDLRAILLLTDKIIQIA